MNYSQLVRRSTEIMDGDLEVPKSIDWEQSIIRHKQVDRKYWEIFKYRNWQVEKIGFPSVSVWHLIESIYNEQYSCSYRSKKEATYEWVYNHHTGSNDKARWKHVPEVFLHEETKGFFCWPPFKLETKWKCKFTTLKSSSCEITTEIMLKILRLQAINLFNAFHVIESCKSSKLYKPSVLLGTVWELPYKGGSVGRAYHYFISEWC